MSDNSQFVAESLAELLVAIANGVRSPGGTPAKCLRSTDRQAHAQLSPAPIFRFPAAGRYGQHHQRIRCPFAAGIAARQ